MATLDSLQYVRFDTPAALAFHSTTNVALRHITSRIVTRGYVCKSNEDTPEQYKIITAPQHTESDIQLYVDGVPPVLIVKTNATHRRRPELWFERGWPIVIFLHANTKLDVIPVERIELLVFSKDRQHLTLLEQNEHLANAQPFYSRPRSLLRFLNTLGSSDFTAAVSVLHKLAGENLSHLSTPEMLRLVRTLHESNPGDLLLARVIVKLDYAIPDANLPTAVSIRQLSKSPYRSDEVLLAAYGQDATAPETELQEWAVKKPHRLMAPVVDALFEEERFDVALKLVVNARAQTTHPVTSLHLTRMARTAAFYLGEYEQAYDFAESAFMQAHALSAQELEHDIDALIHIAAITASSAHEIFERLPFRSNQILQEYALRSVELRGVTHGYRGALKAVDPAKQAGMSLQRLEYLARAEHSIGRAGVWTERFASIQQTVPGTLTAWSSTPDTHATRAQFVPHAPSTYASQSAAMQVASELLRAGDWNNFLTHSTRMYPYLQPFGAIGAHLAGGFDSLNIADYRAWFGTQSVMYIQMFNEPSVSVGQTLQNLSSEQVEVLILLHLYPHGLFDHELKEFLYNGEPTDSVMRARMHTLREYVITESVPYRIQHIVHSDFREFANAFAQRDYSRVLELYTGPVFPESKAPQIERVRLAALEIVHEAIAHIDDPNMLHMHHRVLMHDDVYKTRLRLLLSPNDPRAVMIRLADQHLAGEIIEGINEPDLKPERE